MDFVLLPVAAVLIILGAIGFTNAIEWLGHRLDLGHGATGALLAAVGTALPESALPAVALIGGGGEAEAIAIGSIVGAPFLLGTVAMLLVSGALLAFDGRREHGRRLTSDPAVTTRDLAFFLVCFSVALLLGLGAPGWLRAAGFVGLVAAYAAYVVLTLRGESAGDEEDLPVLFFDTSREDPPNLAQILLQLLVSLGAIIGGAEIFVHAIEAVAKSLGVETLLLALILAPLATELPEKVNSVVWVRQGKDGLALGNITGAMVFQSTLPVCIGLAFTPWDLEPAALVAGATGLIGGLVALWTVRRRRMGVTPSLAWAGLFALAVVLAAVL